MIHDLKGEPFVVAERRNSLQAHKAFTFNLSDTPKTASLDVAMTVVTYACAVKPGLPQGETHVLINGQAVAQFSFAYEDQGKSYKTAVNVDPKLLRTGENKLELVGYRCRLGNYEVVRFHGVGLALDK